MKRHHLSDVIAAASLGMKRYHLSAAVAVSVETIRYHLHSAASYLLTKAAAADDDEIVPL